MNSKSFYKFSFFGAAFSLLTGFGSANPGGGGDNFKPDSQIRLIPSSGTEPGLQPCGIPPMSAYTALRSALSFKAGCHLVKNSTKPMAINDYAAGQPMTYLYVNRGGRYECVGKTPVAWGSGKGRSRNKPLSCADGGANMTPAGFHITRTHNGARYQSHNSIGMVGLNGQNSVGRGVVMHGVDYRIGGSTHGCPAFTKSAFAAVKRVLDSNGSLVYNHFGNAPPTPGCSNNSGLNPNPSSCTPDRGTELGGPNTRGRYRPKKTTTTR